MAIKLDISISYYSKLETSFREPSFHLLKKVKATFKSDVNMNDFFE